MLKINRLREGVLNLGNKILELGGDVILYGEGLADDILYEKGFFKRRGRYYTMLTTLCLNEVLERVGLEKVKPRKGELKYIQLSSEGGFVYKNESYLRLEDKLSEDKYYIKVERSEDVLKRVNENLLIIDKVWYDFRSYYNVEELEDILSGQRILFSAEGSEALSKDALSLFRYIRYKIKYGFREEGEVIKERVGDCFLYPKHVWKQELLSLMELERPSEAFEELRKSNLMSKILNELLEGYNVSQNEYHKYDVYYHSLKACDSACKESPLIRLAALFHDIGKPRSKRVKGEEGEDELKNVFYDHENIGARMTYKILKRFGFMHIDAQRVSNLVRLHMFHYTPLWTDKAVKRFMKKADKELKNLLELRKADRVGSGTKKAYSLSVENLLKRIEEVEKEHNRFKVKDLVIGGDDIMKHFAIEEGPEVGEILDYLVKAVVYGEVMNERESLLKHAENMSLSKKAL